MLNQVWIFVIVYFICFFKAVRNQDISFNDCTVVTSSKRSKLIAYVNWPFKLNCDAINTGTNSSSSQCFVTSSTSSPQTADETIVLPSEALSETSFTLTKVVDDSSCFNDSVVVDVRSLPTRSCFDSVNYYVTRNINVIHKKVVFADPLKMDCKPAPNVGDENIQPPALPSKDYKTVWRYTPRFQNLSLKLDPKNPCEDFGSYAKTFPYRYQLHTSLNSPPSLEIFRPTFYTPGVYSCEIQYKGQTAFITHYSICVENAVTVSKPVVMCNKEKKFFEKDTLTISCEVQTSNYKISSGEMEVKWMKNNDQLCISNYSTDDNNGISPTSKDPSITCGEKGFANRGVMCFEYVPTEEELENYQDKNTFSVFLTLKNLKKSDAGKYVVQMKYKDLWSDPFEIELKFNPERELQRLVVGLVCALVVLAGIVAGVFVIWYNWIQILLFVRRHMGKYDEDGKEFVAILSYFYSDELSESTKSRTQKIVRCVREKMEDLNYKFYDSREHFLEGACVENLLKCLNDSHRMIIILTDAYVDERWARFEAQMGLINMLKNKTKLIVVRTPGAKRALRKIWKKKDDFTNELKEAIKASRNIYWKENMSDERFKDYIQYALPNLRRSHSDFNESSSILQREYKNMTSIISNQTLCSTIPSSPDSLENFRFQASGDCFV